MNDSGSKNSESEGIGPNAGHREQKIRPKKSLGQHFLTSKSALEKIVSTANISAGETVLEIGPGTGILTEALLNAGAKVIAVEKDARVLDLLKHKFAEKIAAGQLILKEGDILSADKKEMGLKEGQYALVANIPYYITGAILESFLEYSPRPSRMVLLVQMEVAERIMARDGKESLLSISVKAFSQPKLVATVPKGAFSPPPKVDSAILSLDAISNAKMTEMGLETRVFFNILKAGFAHKRKFLRRNLETVIPAEKISVIWTKFGLDDRVRAEDLNLEEWVKIAETNFESIQQ